VRKETIRQRTLQPGKQLIERAGERVAATHQRCLRIRLGCSQSAWPDSWLRGFAGSESEGTVPYPRCLASSGPVTTGGPVRRPLGRMVGAAASRHVGLTGGKQLVVLVGQ
jgi:hypothetical protein